MAIVLAEMTLPFKTGIPRDVAINATHWLTSGEPNDADFLAITQELDAFWNQEIDDPDNVLIDGLRFCAFLSPMVQRGENVVSVNFYDAQAVADPAQDAPMLGASSFDLEDDGENENPMPNELAGCLSLTATPALPVLERRRRGRMYVGPLNTLAIGERTEGGIPYPSLNTRFREAAAHVAARMASGPTTVQWAIYSRVNDAAYEISGGWIDNEVDIQRRRGLVANLRTTWSV